VAVGAQPGLPVKLLFAAEMIVDRSNVGAGPPADLGYRGISEAAFREGLGGLIQKSKERNK
jgi:hypothetical protein